MFRIISAIILIHSYTQAHLSAPISPYIGSIPALVNVKTYDQLLQNIIGSAKKYSNGFFWPPPYSLVANILANENLQSSFPDFTRFGLDRFNANEMDFNRLNLHKLNLNDLRLNSLGGFDLNAITSGNLIGNMQIIQIPLSSLSSTQQQCQAPCFICSSQSHASSCTQLINQPQFMFNPMQTSLSPSNQCCCCIRMNK
ncbi:hypothetical protein WUBG_00989 [Wuchereria bancrofti]|uniref:Uncharacterized protein n=1 Tax=Wuchereria bancrofti TaxID=6293 RepID=J9EZS8_WUCBA|nr:hypothetical protein WUBG_00989 [Wuchereria bancrofti]VDM12340.1 unnamed protein product [Wuchereria bancrofti]